MVSKIAGNFRLIVSGIALLGAQTACAGLMLTTDMLQDFQFNKMKVEYNPSYHSLRVTEGTGGNQFSLSGVGSSGDAQTMVGDLHLTAAVTDEDSLSGAFKVLKSTDPTSVLLAGSLEQIQVDHRGGYFVFLAQRNGVTSNSASQYLDSGVQVSFRVTGLGGIGLMDAFGARETIGVLDQSSPQGATPAIPVPGTIALLLIAGLPLAAAHGLGRRSAIA